MVTPRFDVSVPAADGVNVRLVSQAENAAKAKGVGAGQAENPSPFATKATLWKSAGFVPPEILKADVTLIDDELLFNSVAFIVALVVPMATAPKFTGVRSTAEADEVGIPVMGIA